MSGPNGANSSTKINFSSDAFKKYLKNTGWLLFERVTRLLVTFLTGIYLVRYLGPSDFGILAYAISFSGLFSVIAILGIDSIVIRELVKDQSRKDTLLGTAFTMRIIGAVVSIVLTIAGLFANREDPLVITMVAIISVGTLFQTLNVVDYYFQSVVQSKYSVMVQFTTLMLGSALRILFIVLELKVEIFAIVVLVEAVILGGGFYTAYRSQGLTLKKWNFDKSVAVMLLRDGWPLLLSGVMITIYMKIGQIMIKNMLGNVESGYYAAAVRLSEAWYFVPLAVTNSLFPAIVNAKKMSEELYISRLQKLYDLMAWSSFGIAVFVTIFSKQITLILLGENYLASADVLTIYIWAGIGTFLGVASSQYLITENLTRISFLRTAIGMVLNVVLNWLMIPVWGINGSAMATLLSYTAATFGLVFSRKAAWQAVMMLKSIFLINLFKMVFEKWRSLLKNK
ncbi:MAG: flippase [Ignavibacteriaceae bacterium]|nr:flippase [Ignavibacteriaceae bacterium]